jgi:cephalosporin hydroxylase
MTFDLRKSLDAVDRQNAEGTHKTWEDLHRYRRVIHESRPTVVIECGTYKGGSALWFQRQGPQVITIDNSPQWESPVYTIQVVEGNSCAPSTAERVSRFLWSDDRVMVSLDSDHGSAHVAREIKLWAPFVTSGCYLVVEDGIVRWLGAPSGPIEAIEDALVDNADFERDEEIENLFEVTMCPMGWWRRK